ncbi:MAG: ATP-binding protein [Coxiellaceae bacterium]|nr:ATP-binding protein [Coxiellaceae bacterium]
MSNFTGRQKELSLLKNLLKKQTSSLVAIYGRRRIGKSRLIAEFANKHKFISFSGIFPENNTTNQDQLNEFYRRFKDQFKKEPGAFTDWGDAFHKLAIELKTGRVIILLDEITWMGEKDANFLGKLKNVWDMEFKNNNQLILVLCGSVSLWIEKKILCNRGFYGRISLKLRLKELPLNDCNYFFGNNDKQFSDYEKFKILSVTGGIPKYLEEIQQDQSANENIRRLCFSRHGVLYSDYDYIFLSLLERRSPHYHEIITILNHNALERKHIVEKCCLSDTGLLTNYLEELAISGFLCRDYTWHLKSEKISKLSKYRLSDNYLRFYVKYIQPNAARIEKDRFENHSITALPGWATIMGFQIENLVLNNMNQINSLLGIYPDEIINEGPFFQTKTDRQKGCQIDYLVHTKNGVLYLCEIKFSFKGIRSNVITEVKEKINRLSLPRNFSIKPILLHVGDVYEEVFSSNYFSKIVDVTHLLQKPS